MTKPRAVILDVDGTLVDSNVRHARAWVEALAEVGVDVPLERVRNMIGMGGDKLLPKAVGLDPQRGPGKAAAERRSAIFRTRYLPGLRAFPATRELLERFRADGLQLAIATSAKPDELQAMLERTGLDGLVGPRTTGGEAPSKPDPDTVEAVLERIGRRPEEAVMLGDTPYDVEAAGRAGVQTVAVRCGGWDAGELDGAIAVYDDPADILGNYERSVFAGEAAGATERPVEPGERREQAEREGLAEHEAKTAG